MSSRVKTKIIKRNGEEVDFDLSKIVNAIKKANQEVPAIHKMNQHQIRAVADNVAAQVKNSSHAVNVEDIQNMVETGIMEMRGYEVAQKYVRYRYKRELSRKTISDGSLRLNLSISLLPSEKYLIFASVLVSKRTLRITGLRL